MPENYNIRQEAVVRPNACLCKNTSGPFVDFGFDHYGDWVYICHRCVRKIAEAWEFMPRDVFEREMVRLDEANAKVTTLGGELETVRKEALAAVAERDRLAATNEELRQTNVALDAAYAEAKAGPSLFAAARAEIAQPKRKRARASA